MGIEKAQNVQPQQRLQIREGMTVEEVKKYGSDGQKLAASLFDSYDYVKDENGDYKKNGIFNEGEAARFNDFNFSVKDNVFTMYDRKYNQTIEIKYDNKEDLERLLNDEYNEIGRLDAWDDNGKRKAYIGEATKGGKITLDLTEGTVTADGVKGDFIYAYGKKVTIKNSDVEKIGSHADELEIKNTRDEGLLWNSSTKVEAGKDTKVKIDDKSDVKLKRDEE